MVGNREKRRGGRGMADFPGEYIGGRKKGRSTNSEIREKRKKGRGSTRLLPPPPSERRRGEWKSRSTQKRKKKGREGLHYFHSLVEIIVRRKKEGAVQLGQREKGKRMGGGGGDEFRVF